VRPRFTVKRTPQKIQHKGRVEKVTREIEYFIRLL